MSWIFSVTTLATCSFFKYTYIDIDLGLFQGGYEGQCESYGSSSDLQGAHQAGRAFGVLANLCLVFAFVGIALTIFLLHGKAAKMVWISTRIVYVMALLMVLFTFSFLAVDDCSDPSVCELGVGGVINSLNVIVLTVIVSTCWCITVPPAPMFQSCCQSRAAVPVILPVAPTINKLPVDPAINKGMEPIPTGGPVAKELADVTENEEVA